jgi:hypothetical protein
MDGKIIVTNAAFSVGGVPIARGARVTWVSADGAGTFLKIPARKGGILNNEERPLSVLP